MTVTIDRYTKAVLSTIAACLLFQSVMVLDKAVEARQQTAAQPTPVYIVGWDAAALARLPALPVSASANRSLPVTITNGGPLPVALSAPVRLAYAPDQPLPVAINGVKRATGQWEPLAVHVESQMSAVPGAPRP